ncbi:MAG TPA: glutamine--fructose-6-phosphate transaminase (isomerizing) [Methanocorpusculum sp.]|nr:glutamine--fructose-6-phosphate transaminase (isomerizing) [Methanocorpusculum sp.]HJJ53316.1 glutamine--fructose-6-phosphate transaminase (isomerizing) [Methanocorpusculum sp.]
MCGIVGYIGYREAAEVCTSGLLRLEYRGYDSYGIATLSPSLSTHRHLGKISDSATSANHLTGTIGIGHTRWATHGAPSEINSHPHLDEKKKIAVVHNGIIENYTDLKRGLEQRGVVFSSETDTEVIPHLIAEKYTGNLLEAVSSILPLLEGSYALLIIVEGEEKIIAARDGSPLVLGIGDGEFILGSDALPLLEYTHKAVYLEEDDVVEITKSGYQIYNAGVPISREITELEWNVEEAIKGGFPHYMLKEIFEQPEAFANTLSSVKRCNEAVDLIRKAHSITIVACGTSANASMVFSYLLESICRIPARVVLGSEFKYFPTPNTDLVIGVSQSGETADTIAALKLAKSFGIQTLAITNVLGSSITRVASSVIYTRAGPEMSVAATKSFLSQVAAFMQIVNFLSDHLLERELLEIQRYLPQVLNTDLSDAVALCKDASTILYIGRGMFYPVAMEGALKMKEISYIHAEGYAAGELKHGPFALLSPQTPVIGMCVSGNVYPVMMSNLKEIKARSAPIIVIGKGCDTDLEDVADVCISLPPVSEYGSVVLSSVILQLLAYKTAVALGRDVDMPRNLAKSVTVE